MQGKIALEQMNLMTGLCHYITAPSVELDEQNGAINGGKGKAHHGCVLLESKSYEEFMWEGKIMDL